MYTYVYCISVKHTVFSWYMCIRLCTVYCVTFYLFIECAHQDVIHLYAGRHEQMDKYFNISCGRICPQQ